ncbi:hypothetical protein GLOIN_2v1847506, partial [Rhizophagus irregularis DAOM 181602=DAOM 197198]
FIVQQIFFLRISFFFFVDQFGSPFLFVIWLGFFSFFRSVQIFFFFCQTFWSSFSFL